MSGTTKMMMWQRTMNGGSSIKTADQYEQAVKNFDRDKKEKLIKAIPSRINRSGKLYKKLLGEIEST